MSYNNHTERYYSPPPTSKIDAFLDALDRGGFRDAMNVIRSSNSDDRQHHENRHHHRRETEDRYYEDERLHRHGHHHQRGRHPRDRSADESRSTYYQRDEKPLHRGRSSRAHHHVSSPSSWSSSSSLSDYGDHRMRGRARSESRYNWRQAAEAAVTAGLVEGWRSRHNPARTARAVTAAAGAAGTAMLIGRENDRKNKRHVVESMVGDLVLDRVVNGSRKR